MPVSNLKADSGHVNRMPLVFALLATAFVILSLVAGYFNASSNLQIAVFSLATVFVFAVLARLYEMMGRSQYTEKLVITRVHILLHVVPLFFFITLLKDIGASWLNPALVVLFVLFFGSGRKTWQVLGQLFPSTLLYRIFYRANSAFLWSFPVL